MNSKCKRNPIEVAKEILKNGEFTKRAKTRLEKEVTRLEGAKKNSSETEKVPST